MYAYNMLARLMIWVDFSFSIKFIHICNLKWRKHSDTFLHIIAKWYQGAFIVKNYYLIISNSVKKYLTTFYNYYKKLLNTLTQDHHITKYLSSMLATSPSLHCSIVRLQQIHVFRLQKLTIITRLMLRITKFFNQFPQRSNNICNSLYQYILCIYRYT